MYPCRDLVLQHAHEQPVGEAAVLRQSFPAKGPPQGGPHHQGHRRRPPEVSTGNPPPTQVEQDLRQREVQKRNNYRNDLLQQIEERRLKEHEMKNSQLREKEAFQHNSKVPAEIQRYEKEKKKQ